MSVPLLLVDATAGRLCRWLRLLGFDAAYHPGPGTGDVAELFARARREGRRVVTRSSRVEAWAPEEVLRLGGDELEGQLAEVLAWLGEGARELVPFSRCSICNLPVRPLGREEAAGLVPPHVLGTRKVFGRCPCCGRVYWKATHCEGIAGRLAPLARRAGGALRLDPGA